ncbi:MAG TPA: hypothetical protein VMZ28_17635 [Kofleriaceae bacterium]|nr:hypothetical protein [Kofleriaceae bacterium]
MRRALPLLLAILCACSSDEEEDAPPPPAPPPAQPRRVATQDENLRVLVAELTAAKSCEMIKGQFRGLKDRKDPKKVTGVVWIRECRVTHGGGTGVTFHLGGNGWQWVEVVKKKAGATFDLRQYVRFEMQLEVTGTLDLGYEPKSHIVTFWFTPKSEPAVRFEPIGEVDMDEEGTWSAVVGAMSVVTGETIDGRAEKESKKNGTKAFRGAFADGFAVTMDLCKGLSRFGLERPEIGTMVAPDPGESKSVAIELNPGGLMLFGPYEAPRGMTIDVTAREGEVQTDLICQEEAEELAEVFLSGADAVPPTRTLSANSVAGREKLKARAGKCKVVVMARTPPGAKKPVTFDWLRPPKEHSRATMGGPILQCNDRS